MSTARLLKATAALSDLAQEPGSSNAQRLANLRAVQRHVDGLVRKLESEDPTRNRPPSAPIAHIQS